MDYYPGLTIGKRPAAIRVYQLGFAKFLASGDTPNGAVVTADAGITAAIVGTGDDYVKVKISGGSLSTIYAVELVVATTLGEAVDMLIKVEVPSE